MRIALLALSAAVAALLALASSAAAATLAPFGHACSAQDGVRFCPTATDPQRVPTFDGVPLDVDVTLPASGNGPFPTVVILHGFPGTKQSFEATSPSGKSTDTQTYHWNNVFFAQQGYAVVNYSSRGFGRSCGVQDSRSSGCERGWFHFGDQRYEIHDTQFLLTKLVDEGVVDPARIGVTGTSYGGGQTEELAFIGDRIRTIAGDFAPWRSARGKAIRVVAAWPRWGWSDFMYAAVPNGRFLDYRTPVKPTAITPLGVLKQSIFQALYVGGLAVGYEAPQGADPTADLATAYQTFGRGEPYRADAVAIARQFENLKSAAGLSGRAAPLLILNGWTDPVFPPEEALRTYNRLRAANRRAPVSLQFGDIGHFRTGNALAAYRVFNDEGAAFFAHYLRGRRGGPQPGHVTVLGQGCPKGTVGPGPFTSASWSSLARGALPLRRRRAATLTASGGSDAIGKAIDPVKDSDPCSTFAAASAPGTAVLTRRSRGFVLAGPATIAATVKSRGGFGQIDVRIWDVSGAQQRLIDHGTYRLLPGQKGKIVLQTFGNVYRFARGHVVKVELLGRDSPSFLADGGFSVRVSNLTVDLPTIERPGRSGIVKPLKRH